MRLEPGVLKAAKLYAGALDLLAAPALTMALSKLMTLFWAFQLHGWAYCIPCIACVFSRLKQNAPRHA